MKLYGSQEQMVAYNDVDVCTLYHISPHVLFLYNCDPCVVGLSSHLSGSHVRTCGSSQRAYQQPLTHKAMQ